MRALPQHCEEAEGVCATTHRYCRGSHCIRDFFSGEWGKALRHKLRPLQRRLVLFMKLCAPQWFQNSHIAIAVQECVVEIKHDEKRLLPAGVSVALWWLRELHDPFQRVKRKNRTTAIEKTKA
jgi:hypothetical protein